MGHPMLLLVLCNISISMMTPHIWQYDCPSQNHPRDIMCICKPCSQESTSLFEVFIPSTEADIKIELVPRREAHNLYSDNVDLGTTYDSWRSGISVYGQNKINNIFKKLLAPTDYKARDYFKRFTVPNRLKYKRILGTREAISSLNDDKEVAKYFRRPIISAMILKMEENRIKTNVFKLLNRHEDAVTAIKDNLLMRDGVFVGLASLIKGSKNSTGKLHPTKTFKWGLRKYFKSVSNISCCDVIDHNINDCDDAGCNGNDCNIYIAKLSKEMHSCGYCSNGVRLNHQENNEYHRDLALYKYNINYNISRQNVSLVSKNCTNNLCRWLEKTQFPQNIIDCISSILDGLCVILPIENHLWNKTVTNSYWSFISHSHLFLLVCKIICAYLSYLMFSSRGIYYSFICNRSNIMTRVRADKECKHPVNPGKDEWCPDWGKSYYIKKASKTWSNNSYATFMVKPQMERAASFAGFYENNNTSDNINNSFRLSTMKLAQLGFLYGGNGQEIKCADCGAIVQINDIVDFPSNKKYHLLSTCQFATTGNDNDVGSCCQSPAPPPTTHSDHDQVNYSEIASEAEMNSELGGARGNITRTLQEVTKPDQKDHGRNNPRTSFKEDRPYELDPHSNCKHHSQNGSDSSYAFDMRNRKQAWVDEGFRHERAPERNDPECSSVEQYRCDVLDTHTILLSPTKITLEQIPVQMRCHQIHDIILSISDLTVNLRVAVKSELRPNRDFRKNKGAGFGSGSAYIPGVDRAHSYMKELSEKYELSPSQRKIWNHCQNGSPSNGVSQEFYFTITTSTHVVFDQYEAENTTVEFFYDSEDRQNVVIAQGVAVKHSDVYGEYKSYLICKTQDKDFIRRLYKTRQELKNKMEEMPENVKIMLVNNCFVVFHPHGLEKKVSFGKCAVSKYGLCDTDDGARKMTYLSDKDAMSKTKDVREVLLYTAATCPGSSGSPVFTARKIGQNLKPEPDMWLHNGVEKSTDLGGSIMRTVDPTERNIEEPVPLKVIAARLKECPDTKNSTATSSTPQPAPRSQIPPLYPEYYTWERRLSSFNNPKYKSKCRHSPAELAVAGFFYAGTTPDTVRCFYCGLGLREWAPSYDINVEHEKAKPNCGFLKLCKDWKGVLNLDMMNQVNSVVFPAVKELTTALTISLLEHENRLLKLQKVCKMCFRYDNKEIFLPCGEVLVCNACMDILSTCPSCNSKIEASASVYLS